jgi:hypothetical protein
MHSQIRKVVRRDGTAVEATLEISINAAIGSVLDFVAAEKVLPKVLTGYRLLPGVVGTSRNTGPWDQPGSSRTVHLADGTTAREQVLDYHRPRYFAYRTSDYTFSLRHLSTGAKGRWWFEEKDGQTSCASNGLATCRSASKTRGLNSIHAPRPYGRRRRGRAVGSRPLNWRASLTMALHAGGHPHR